ncbi:EscU/YscU/HrcU family type III secretion system export apparatus switch protein [Jeotgalibacillus proteolyticus]
MPKYFNHAAYKKLNGPSAAVLKYDDEGGPPKVVAKGNGLLAERIIELANEHDLHLEENEGLLLSLLELDLGDSIPPQLYTVIAEMMIFIEEMDKRY